MTIEELRKCNWILNGNAVGGFSYFHCWVHDWLGQKSIHALVEDQDGRMRLIKHSEIQFIEKP